MATSEPLPQTEQCPECHGRVETTPAEAVCAACGLVVESDRIDHGPEWRSFADDTHDPERAAPGNPDRDDRGLGSRMGHDGERDGYDRKLNVVHQRSKYRKADRNRGYATTEIRRIGSQLDLADGLCDQATRLFRSLHDDGLALGRDLDTLAATCVYTTLRVNRTGHTPDDVGAVARTDATRIARRHTWLCDALGIEVPPPDAAARVRRVAGRVGVDESALNAALSRLNDLDGPQVARGSPSTLAAALLWDVADVTQRAVADAAGCSPAGVRKRAGRL